MMQTLRCPWLAPRARTSRPAMEPQPQTQSIAGVFTPRLVARLHREGFEGTLRLHAGGATRVVYFRRGDIASAASNADEDRLHNILIREGRLTGPQVEMARSRQRPGASLGKVLIELGFLTPSELLQGARRQVRQILAACFALTEGTWQAAAGPLGPEVTNLGLPARRLIFDALMEAGDRRAIVREMGSMESIYQPTAAIADALPALRLEPAMEAVARMIDGRATLREISSRTRLDDFTVSRIVLALEILGLAGLSTRPEPVVAPRPGRIIPVEGDDAGGAAIAILPAAAPAAATGPATATPFAPEPPRAAEPSRATEPPPTAEPPPAPPHAWTAPAGAEESGETVRLPASALSVAPPPAFDRRTPLPARAESTPGPTAFPPEPAAAAEAEPPAQLPEGEPPPFAPGELPAFADGTQQETPVWTVNPETGERVHEGPIELTFDGPLAPDRSARPNARLIVAAGAGVIVVAALAVSYYVRSQARGTAQATPGAAGEAPVATASAETSPVPQEDAGAPGETAGGDAAAGGIAAGGTAAVVEDVAAGETAVGAPTGRTPGGGADGAAAGEPPAEREPPTAAAGPDNDRLAPGQALLDAGDVTGAAAAFRDALAALPADRVTLQIMIACEEATVRKARAALASDDPLFVTPFTMHGRSCHRLLWGIYADRGAAQAGASTLPPYFTGAGISPVVVSIGRLRGPS